jgi:hypothetical protein
MVNNKLPKKMTLHEKQEYVKRVFPEILNIKDKSLAEKVVEIWLYFLERSTYKRIEDAPYPGVPQYSLVNHIRVTAKAAIEIAKLYDLFYSIKVDMDRLIAVSLIHDVSCLVEYEGEGENTKKTELGAMLDHPTEGAVVAKNLGFPLEIANMILLHSQHPPHTHIEPPSLEFIIFLYADLALADGLMFLVGEPTHLSIRRRFFQYTRGGLVR